LARIWRGYLIVAAVRPPGSGGPDRVFSHTGRSARRLAGGGRTVFSSAQAASAVFGTAPPRRWARFVAPGLTWGFWWQVQDSNLGRLSSAILQSSPKHTLTWANVRSFPGSPAILRARKRSHSQSGCPATRTRSGAPFHQPRPLPACAATQATEPLRTQHESADRGVGDLTFQIACLADGLLASHLLVEAALCADQGVWAPPHHGTLCDLLARCAWPQGRYFTQDQRSYRPAAITLWPERTSGSADVRACILTWSRSPPRAPPRLSSLMPQ
jgi:hypothetical protein